MRTIMVKSLIGSERAVEQQQAYDLFAAVFAELLVPVKDRIAVDFTGVTEISTDFLAAGLAALVGAFTEEELLERLELSSLGPHDLKILRNLMALRRRLTRHRGDQNDF